MDARHIKVFGECGTYAGWPANHGAWQWGDEFLVGFLQGKHNPGYGMHNVSGGLIKMQARSLDGGESWTVEYPNVDFEAQETRPSPKFDTTTSIIRVCGGYDHGGELCHREGGFYLSRDRGKTWDGAFSFDGFNISDKQMATSRTCVLGDLIFLSARNSNHWGSDFTFCAKMVDGKFFGRSIVLSDDARAVMPAVARVRGRIVVAMRRLGTRRPGGWIDSVLSDDEGLTWSEPVHVAETGRDNGNPPALIESDGVLYCAYGNRSSYTIEVMSSKDGGYSWQAHAELRRSSTPDIGYPRLFRRTDGKLVCVYYWTEEFEEPQRIEATIFAT